MLFFSSPAEAGYIVTLEQVGPNVVATGTGAIDLTGLTFNSGAQSLAVIVSAIEAIQTVAIGSFTDVCTGPITGPSSFGSGGLTLATRGTGDLVGISIQPSLFVPTGHVSGNALSDTVTYNSATFASLGVTPGTYVWSWGGGADQNFTLQIGSAGVPDTGSTIGPGVSRPGSVVFLPAGVAGPISLTIRRINRHLRTPFWHRRKQVLSQKS